MSISEFILLLIVGYYAPIGFLAIHKFEYLWPMNQEDIYKKAKSFYDNEEHFRYFIDNQPKKI